MDATAKGFPEESPVCLQGFGSPLQGEYFLGLGSEGVALGYDGFAFQAMSCVFHGAGLMHEELKREARP
jgi:hypothetical protein